MSYVCKECGEVLFGAVNRCWKCGTEFEIAVNLKVPPVRREPVVLASDQAAAIQSGTSTLGPGSLPFPMSIPFSELGRKRSAIASVVLGSLGCLWGLFSGWAIVLGMLGVALGLIGMLSHRDRDTATMGLVLSVIAFFLGAGQIAFHFWVQYASQRWIDDLQGIGP